ncbi:MAG: SufD family Fe-S cluster assembly protein [Candidatus Bathyarchaeia archaeon]
MPELTERALRAKEKKSAFGLDVDLSEFDSESPQLEPVEDLTSLSGSEQAAVSAVGVSINESERSGTFLQIDHRTCIARSYDPGVEVMSIDEALSNYPWVKDYYWQIVQVDADKYTAQAELKRTSGYFIRVLPGRKVQYPLQSCLFLSHDRLAQNLHNIVIVEEDAEAHIITGCTISPRVRRGLHIGVSEFYIKRNARLVFTMIHNWGEEVAVRPRSAGLLGENSSFTSNYICMRPVRSLQMYPTTYLNGRNSSVRYNSILLANPDSELDVGGRAVLNSPGSSAEIVSRAVTIGGKVWARGHLLGASPGIKGHLQCNGLILKEGGFIKAIPELEANSPDVTMTHEASVGKIAQEEIEYLMARGISEEEAIALIVRGFVDIKIEGLGPELERELDQILTHAKGM